MRNIKEIGRAIAAVGILASPISGCGTRARDVQLEDLSKDPCAFTGQTISTSGFPRDLSEKLIYEEIFTRPGLCVAANTAANIFSMDTKYYECLEKITVINETIKTNFNLQSKPENHKLFTNATHIFTISGVGKVNHLSVRKKYNEIFNGKIKVNGKIIKQKGMCLLYADEIKRKE